MKLTAKQECGLAMEIAEMLFSEDVDQDAAKRIVQDALSELDGLNEAAWQRQQESLMESGGPDDSAYRQQLRDAGRGHLVK